MTTPLAILDLAPITSGGDAPTALRNTLDLARLADDLGYHRFWVAEHHTTPGVASAAPAVLIEAIANVTSRIRVGAGAVQTGHQMALPIVEQFATLEFLHPGRIDLGLGRSGQRVAQSFKEQVSKGLPPPAEAKVVDGLLIPPPFSYAAFLDLPRLAFTASLLVQPGATSPTYDEQIGQILDLLAGELRDPNGNVVEAVPGTGARPDIWVFGSSAGESAQVAGARGLRFAANYHVTPATTLGAIDAYRSAFRPSAELAEPYVAVSADVVVADDEQTARRLAEPFALFVHSVRSGRGAVPYPSPEEADAFPWTPEDRAMVADRVDTQFVGTPDMVVEQLRTLERVTGAQELVVTTITHDHADRRRSTELLAKAWGTA